VGGPSERLSTIPAGEGVGGETGVDEGEVRAIEYMVEVVVVVVHLRRRELTLVHDVLGRKRADKEALGEGSASSGAREHSVANLGETADSHFVGNMLPEHVELALEALDVEGPILGGSAVAVVLAVDDERLEDRGLLGARRGAEDGAIRGDLTPAEDPQTVVDRSLGEDGLLLAELDGVVRLKEDVPDGVLARRGERAPGVLLRLALEEGVRDPSHDARAVAVARVGASRAAVGHRAQELARIGHDLVGGRTLDVADEADTTCVLLVLILV
jgi:hypothetical protein